MSSVELRWVTKETKTARASERAPRDVVDSLTVIAGVSRLLEERWADLSDEQRQDLTAMLRRRADLLLAALSEVLRLR